MAKEWIVKCKDCGNDFGYSDWSYRTGETKGESRPERCPECRKKHNRQTALMGAAYFEIKPRPNVDTSHIHPGSLGALSHPQREHKAIEREAGYDPSKFGVSDDDIRALFEWFDPPGHHVAVVVGPTGSGKSTALPFRLINPPSGIPEDRFTRYGQVLITQPRIQATRNIPAYVAKDLYGSSIGSGFDVGFRYKDNPYSDWRNRLVYATDGTLINWIASGQIANLSVIMIDEAHERSLNIDLILGLLKKLLPRYPHLKLIVASATIDSGLFVDFFGRDTAKLIEFQGKRKFNVDTYFADETKPLPYETLPKLLKSIPAEVAKKVIWLLEEIGVGNKSSGDILAFLQGERPIEQAVTLIRQAARANERLTSVDVFPLYTTLAQDDQNKALLKKPDPSRRRVVVTTNVAETSLTVEDIVYIVDSGLINEAQWNIATQTKQVVTVLHSQAGCKQRWGRGGRVRDGQAYCLYTEKQFKTLFPEYTVPQIQRSDLEPVVLAAKAAGIDDLTSFDWIPKPPFAELERAPRSLQKIGALDPDGYLTEHGLELQSLGEEPAMGHLMAMADRFSCAIEMATIIPMIKLGGIRYLFRNERTWDAPTRREVNRIHESITKSCLDDIELCLKIYAAWSEPEFAGQALIPYWAFLEIWPKYIPPLTKEIQQALGEKRTEELRERATHIGSYEDLQKLSNEFGHGEQIKRWFEDAKLAVSSAKREAWAKANFINPSTLKNKIEPQRETLLKALSGHKKETERRPIDFRLLDRVRIIFAFCLPDRRYTLIEPDATKEDARYQAVVNDGISVQPGKDGEAIIQISQDSVLYERAPRSFVCGRQQVVTRRTPAEQGAIPVANVSFLSLLRQEWLEKLERSGISEIDLALFIAQQTRDEASGELKGAGSRERLFLDQIFPIGSRYVCTIKSIQQDGTTEIEPIRNLADPVEIIEDFRGDDYPILETLEIAENVDPELGELADTVLSAADAPVANPEEDVQPAWMDLEGHPAEENLLSSEEIETLRLARSEKLEVKRISDKYRWKLEVSDGDSYEVGDFVRVEVINHDFDQEDIFVTVLRPIPDPEPFEVFAREYHIGDVVSLNTLAYDQRPGDYLASLIVQEPVSKLEIVLEPEKLTFSTRSFVVKEIPLGIEIKAEVETVDRLRRRIGVSCLPVVENHLNHLVARQRSKDGVFELGSAIVREITPERIFVSLPWSDPSKGLIHVVGISGRGLYKPAENFTLGEECTLRLSFSKNRTHGSIPEIPHRIESLIAARQQEFSILSWENGTLSYEGRMNSSARKNLKSPVRDRIYYRAIDDLYRLSNQLTAETIDTDWPNRAAKYPVGRQLTVKVMRIVDFGAFVEIEPGLHGLIHKSRIAWGGVDDPNKVVKIGETVQVTVERIDPEKHQIALTMLRVETDPFLKYRDGHKQVGVIKKIIPAGLIVELEPGVSGLVHVSKISRNFMSAEELAERYELEEAIEVTILSVDLANRRLSFDI